MSREGTVLIAFNYSSKSPANSRGIQTTRGIQTKRGEGAARRKSQQAAGLPNAEQPGFSGHMTEGIVRHWYLLEPERQSLAPTRRDKIAS
jgi:hypothetical protein